MITVLSALAPRVRRAVAVLLRPIRPRRIAEIAVPCFGFAALICGAQPAVAQFAQQGPKLVGAGAINQPVYAQQGWSVALSDDGSTAVVGGPHDNTYKGAVWVFTRSGSSWSAGGHKLIANDAVEAAFQGQSVALSADGSTLIVGGPGDNLDVGAAYVFTQSNGVWTEQKKLVASDSIGNSAQGTSVGLSADGNTAIVGGVYDNGNIGAAWIFVRSGGNWSEQQKLIGKQTIGSLVHQGYAVGLSGDGHTAIVGGNADNTGVGAAWVFAQSGSTWSQQAKLVGKAHGAAEQGSSVALSSDGSVALVGGPNDSSFAGAAWVFTRSGSAWKQQAKLVGTGTSDHDAEQGHGVALSSAGNLAIVGGPNDGSGAGAAWVFSEKSGVWTQEGSKLVGKGGAKDGFDYGQGYSVALSGDGSTAIAGAPSDHANAGAAWVFAGHVAAAPALAVTPTTEIATSGDQGGPFSPSSFSYKLSATSGSVKYSITGVPKWLTASSTSGKVTTAGKTIIFTVNATAKTLAHNTYVDSIKFNNTTNKAGDTTRTATLTVKP